MIWSYIDILGQLKNREENLLIYFNINKSVNRKTLYSIFLLTSHSFKLTSCLIKSNVQLQARLQQRLIVLILFTNDQAFSDESLGPIITSGITKWLSLKWLLQSECKSRKLHSNVFPYRWFPEGVCHFTDNQRDVSWAFPVPKELMFMQCICLWEAHSFPHLSFFPSASSHPSFFCQIPTTPQSPPPPLPLCLFFSSFCLLLCHSLPLLLLRVSCEIQPPLCYCFLQRRWMFKKMQMLHDCICIQFVWASSIKKKSLFYFFCLVILLF